MPSRDIEDILHFRSDISPFLVHLTRDYGGHTADELLSNIISEQQLLQGDGKISDARFSIRDFGWNEEKIKRFFGAICFTETPLSEVHAFLDIDRRRVDLQPYGLVFLKEKLAKNGVSPVLYINNIPDDKDVVIQELCRLIDDNNARQAAKILPLLSVFGTRLTQVNARKQTDEVDFRWEREWRYPYYKGNFAIRPKDVFVGLCPHEDIARYERRFLNSFGQPVHFIDPRRNMKWYASKLIAARRRLGMKDSVV